MADYGQVIPPADVDALYAAMRQAYLDRARPPVHTPRARIIEVFDAALLEQRTVELLSARALPASNK
jgi:hypothetical protein